MKSYFDVGFLIIRRNALETRENGNDFNDSSIWTIFDGPILSNRGISKFFQGFKNSLLPRLNDVDDDINCHQHNPSQFCKCCVHFCLFLRLRIFWLIFVRSFTGSGPEMTVSEYVTYCMCIMHPSSLEAFNLKLLL